MVVLSSLNLDVKMNLPYAFVCKRELRYWLITGVTAMGGRQKGKGLGGDGFPSPPRRITGVHYGRTGPVLQEQTVIRG